MRGKPYQRATVKMPWSCESLANNPIVAKKVTDESTVFAFSLGGSNFEFGLKWSRCSPLFWGRHGLSLLPQEKHLQCTKASQPHGRKSG